ncbi:unnamed protein product [Blepharisma stoltei]|uniref:ubiquitinyl hydrolase 1 n=1 Tax=Blepharisma stoltei TaxID=1481888 RepID=A0AAU9KDS9_9CILI|nr:unnamed protein product [Blepharisma stoltei]
METSCIPLNAEYRCHGLHNSGNSCFLNVSAQFLMAIGPFYHLSQNVQGDYPFLRSILQAYTCQRLLEPSSPFWLITELFLGYTPRAIRQNCAGEFLRFFLGNLDEELKHIRPRQEHDDSFVEAGKRNNSQSVSFRARGQSVLYDILGLCIKNEYKAKGHTSICFQEELVLAVQVEANLTTAISKALAIKTVEDYCIDGIPTTCTVKSQIASFSPFLLIHIQRFTIVNGKVQKISQHVEFPRTFTIPLKFLSPSLKLSTESGHVQPPTYELKGIIEHHGEFANSGHYTAVIHHGNSWILIDDNQTRFITPDSVRSKQAYILLYQQNNKENI